MNRPVWLTREQRDLLTRWRYRELDEIVAAWDAAPADPAEAIDRVLTSLSGDLHRERIEQREAVLAALGMPEVKP